MTLPLKLYGVKISMFTGKVRSYLIKQGMAFEEIGPFSEHYRENILPVIGRQIIPVIETSDGTIVQDTTDIIDYLEANTQPKMPTYPSDPLAIIAALILELFGDNGLMRPAMHYRWNFPETTNGFITHGFGGWQGPNAPPDVKEKIAKTIKKFSGFLPILGVTPATITEVERAYIEILEILEGHFLYHPYFMGDAPNMGDYGMMCSLYAHLGRDPVPSSLMKNHAPSLYRWTERMNVSHADYSDMPSYSVQTAKMKDGLPETLGPLWSYMARYFLPELEMGVETLAALPEPAIGSRASIHPKQYVLGFGGFLHGDVDIHNELFAP